MVYLKVKTELENYNGVWPCLTQTSPLKCIPAVDVNPTMENIQFCTTDLPLKRKKDSLIFLKTLHMSVQFAQILHGLFFPFRFMLTSLLTFCNPSILGIMQTEFCQHLTVPSRDPSKWRVLASYTSNFRVNLEHLTYCMEDSMESPAENQVLFQERFHLSGKNFKLVCLDFLILLHYVFFLDLNTQVNQLIWKKHKS